MRQQHSYLMTMAPAIVVKSPGIARLIPGIIDVGNILVDCVTIDITAATARLCMSTADGTSSQCTQVHSHKAAYIVAQYLTLRSTIH